ncbi:MAG: sodium:proton antiporter [Phycisphaerae bacterium]
MPAVSIASPGVGWSAPFAALLLCIAILPLVPRTAHWWEHNRNKLLLGVLLGLLTLAYYGCRGLGTPLHDPTVARAMHAVGFSIDEAHGHAHTSPGWSAALGALGNAAMEYIPFILLLFSLYTISGGIAIRGDLPAHPVTNAAFLGLGAVLASLVGTTGASMLLIRPLLQTNSERKHKAHTVIFFIFLVSNIGGSLLPIGDPPLFLGFLRGVPFLWTLRLWKEWAFAVAVLLLVYLVFDTLAYRREQPIAILRDETQRQRLHVLGGLNTLWLLLVLAIVGFVTPGQRLPGTQFVVPPFLRELAMLLIVLIAWTTTPRGLRHATGFSFAAMAEVAALFVGIFLTMQVPIEILNARGASLGLHAPWHFFWATGSLSSFLDNAPTYVVFFETANALTTQHVPGETLRLLTGQVIRQDHLVAISLGAVFMGANTYIGNGPNFMVKSIAERAGVRMPSFFGYMLYSGAILLPLFGLITWLFVH